MLNKRISISLPAEMCNRLNEYKKLTGIPTSILISKSLELYFDTIKKTGQLILVPVKQEEDKNNDNPKIDR